MDDDRGIVRPRYFCSHGQLEVIRSSIVGEVVPYARRINCAVDFRLLSTLTSTVAKHSDVSQDPSLPVSVLNEKALGETQTLRAGRSNAEPKIFAPPQTPSQGRRTAKI